MANGLTNLTEIIISQYVHILNHYIVHLKLTVLYVRYSFIFLKKLGKFLLKKNWVLQLFILQVIQIKNEKEYNENSFASSFQILMLYTSYIGRQLPLYKGFSFEFDKRKCTENPKWLK